MAKAAACDSDSLSVRSMIMNSITQPCNACCPWRSSYLEQDLVIKSPPKPDGDTFSGSLCVLPQENASVSDKMIYAVRKRDVELLQKIIDNETGDFWCEIFQFLKNNERSTSPVELACTLGYTDIVQVYLDNGCSSNLPTTHGRLIHTVLICIKSGTIKLEDGQKLIRYLCENGCNVNIRDLSYKTTLLHASELGDVKIMEILLSVADPVLITYTDVPNEFTPLHMSAMRGDLDCVLILLKYCSPCIVNLCDSKGNTALALALKAMCQNLIYMNNLVHDSASKSKCKLQIENLSRLQHNSVAIVEALLESGTEPDSSSCMFHSTLYKALALVRKDDTAGMFEMKKFSETFQIVARKRIQDLKFPKDNKTPDPNKKEIMSPYTGIVRLLVLHGFRIPEGKSKCLEVFSDLPDLINEIFDFIDNTENNERVLKLMHLSKQAIRNCLAVNQNLHLIEKLALPPSLCSYIKLQVF